MKKLLGLLAGILCVLGLLAVPAPQEADAATGVSYVYFHYTNLVLYLLMLQKANYLKYSKN